MATLEQQLEVELKRLADAESLLKSAKYQKKVQGDKITAATKRALQEAPKKISDSKQKVASLRKRIMESKAPQLSEQQKKIVNEGAARDSLPMGVDDKLWNLIKADIPNLSGETFQTGGIGAGILVYQGQKPGTIKSPTGGAYPQKVDSTALTNDVISSFWTDKAVQRKVLNALIAAGNRNVTQLDAFATWQSVVQQSATLYAAGKGPKFTPMDILNMSITKAGGAKPDVTTYLDVPKDNELKQVLKDRLFPILRKEVGDNDPLFQSLFSDIKRLYQKGETTTTTVDPKTGRKTVKRTGGVTDAMIKAKIDKYYNENNQDFLEAKSLEAVDYFSQWQRS